MTAPTVGKRQDRSGSGTSRLLAVHLRIADVLLRLVQLHALWVGWTLRGGVVLGVFPATAAVAAIARRDALGRTAAGSWGELRRDFARHWRAQFRHANALGWILAAAGALILIEERVMRAAGDGAIGVFVAGVLWMLGAGVAALGVLVWPLAAHFDARPLAVIRGAVVLLLGRPLAALAPLGAAAALAAAYYLVPGLIPAFGVAGPLWLVTAVLLRGGALPAAPAAAPEPR